MQLALIVDLPDDVVGIEAQLGAIIRRLGLGQRVEVACSGLEVMLSLRSIAAGTLTVAPAKKSWFRSSRSSAPLMKAPTMPRPAPLVDLPTPAAQLPVAHASELSASADADPAGTDRPDGDTLLAHFAEEAEEITRKIMPERRPSMTKLKPPPERSSFKGGATRAQAARAPSEPARTVSLSRASTSAEPATGAMSADAKYAVEARAALEAKVAASVKVTAEAKATAEGIPPHDTTAARAAVPNSRPSASAPPPAQSAPPSTQSAPPPPSGVGASSSISSSGSRRGGGGVGCSDDAATSAEPAATAKPAPSSRPSSSRSSSGRSLLDRPLSGRGKAQAPPGPPIKVEPERKMELCGAYFAPSDEEDAADDEGAAEATAAKPAAAPQKAPPSASVVGPEGEPSPSGSYGGRPLRWDD